MPQAHVEQVVAKIQAYGIRPDTPGAIARYLRFPGAIDAFLLYCLALADEYLLAILYPARVPFGSVRRQAERLAEMLTQPAAPPVPAGAGARPVPTSAAVEEIVRLPHDWVPQPSARYSLPFLETRTEPGVPVSAPASLPGDWLPEGGPLQVVDSILESAPVDERNRPSPAVLPPTAVERTRVSLVYVPRDPELALQTSLAATLVTWTKEICRALDFRPVDIHVRPDALCLTIELPTGTSPPTAAHRMRQELSRRIAETYPSQAAAAASGRFWTSRYLLMSGEAPSSQRITEFVRETRGTSRAHRVTS
jgi:REP element-mobilizing transposase RayT